MTVILLTQGAGAIDEAAEVDATDDGIPSDDENC